VRTHCPSGADVRRKTIHQTKGKAMLRAILLAFALTLSAVPVAANTFDDAEAAYKRGDYETAVRLLRQLAEQGDAQAQYNLGLMYDGRGVPQDYVESLKWYRMAAEQGHANAQLFLGLMYKKGKGIPQDDAESVRWYRMAAEQGDANAQLFLGFAYGTGKGVQRDYVLGHKWCNLAAAQGDESGIKCRDVFAKSMTSEQTAEAQRMARDWKPK
jgi:TPR repeat protein